MVSMSHIRCMYLHITHQRWARIVEDSPGWLGWSHMSHRCMYHPRNTFTPKVGRIVETVRIVGMVSHVSHSVHVPPKEHIYTKVGQDS
jgi:hypothetical protein